MSSVNAQFNSKRKRNALRVAGTVHNKSLPQDRTIEFYEERYSALIISCLQSDDLVDFV